MRMCVFLRVLWEFSGSDLAKICRRKQCAILLYPWKKDYQSEDGLVRMEAIKSLKNKFGGSDLFGVEKDASFHSSIGQIYQTWDGKDLYIGPMGQSVFQTLPLRRLR